MVVRAKPEDVCPYCKSTLEDPAVRERAQREFEREVSAAVRGVAREKIEEYRKQVSETKKGQREAARRLRSQAKERERLLKARIAATLRREMRARKSALAKLKRSHQYQLINLREVYDRESLRAKSEQESAFNAQLKEIIQNYGNLATLHQKELERVKKAHDENEILIRRKDSDISKLRVELARSSSKLEAKELMLQLHERNATIEKLGSRIQDLESRLGEQPQAPTPKEENKSMTADEQREKLKEYMRAIIEITRSQQAKKIENSRQGPENPAEGMSESKADKLRGLFF